MIRSINYSRHIVLVSLLALSACGTSPEPDFYTLMPEAPAKLLVDKVAQAALVSIKVRRPTIAAYLDRPDFVRQDSDYQIYIDEMTRWGEPLDRMAERVFAEDLRQRMPSSFIVTEASHNNDNVRFIVDIDMQQFNATTDGKISLRGNMVILDKGQPPHSAPFVLTAECGSGADDIAAGLSKLLGQLADNAQSQIAAITTIAAQK